MIWVRSLNFICYDVYFIRLGDTSYYRTRDKLANWERERVLGAGTCDDSCASDLKDRGKPELALKDANVVATSYEQIRNKLTFDDSPFNSLSR